MERPILLVLILLVTIISCKKEEKIDNNTFTDSRDGQLYETVTIGNQTWFAENLNFETSDSWCIDTNTLNCNTYGRLYDWNAALTACPNGWHLPSDDEWKELELLLGVSNIDIDSTGARGTNQGGQLKETGVSHWKSPNAGATNITGFNALPAGCYLTVSSESVYFTEGGWWWTSTDYTDEYALNRHLWYDDSKIHRLFYNKKGAGFSVRCVKD